MRVPSRAATNSWSAIRAVLARGSVARVLVVPVDVVHARELLDLETSELPSALNDPGERAIEARRFLFDLLKHRLREVQALLPLVGLRGFILQRFFVAHTLPDLLLLRHKCIP